MVLVGDHQLALPAMDVVVDALEPSAVLGQYRYSYWHQLVRETDWRCVAGGGLGIFRYHRAAYESVRTGAWHMNTISQLGILLFGVTAIWLSQSVQQKYRRWSCIAGLMGQPFWFYSAVSTGSWGVFIVCILYTLAWFKGFWTHWVMRAGDADV